MSRFEQQLERHDPGNKNVTPKRITTNQLLDERIGGFLKGVGDAVGKVGTGVGKAVKAGVNAIDDFAAGAEKFNKAADESPLKAAQQGMQGLRDYGKTKGDINLQNRIKTTWENMTAAQQAMYNTPNQHFEQLATTDPKYSAWKGLTGFQRYEAEQEFASKPGNEQLAQQYGITGMRKPGTPSSNNQAAWDNYIQQAWNKMEPAEKQLYGDDMSKFEQIERARQQRNK